MEKVKQYYTTIYSVAYSSCGYYLAAASNFGSIAIFNLSAHLDKDEGIQVEGFQKCPLFKFSAHSGPIYTLISSKKFLISGSIGEMKAWKWSDLKRKEAKPVWTYYIPQGENLTKPEVNSIVLGSKEDESMMYIGCGDNKVHCLDVETQSLKVSLEGHTDYILCVCVGNNGHECVSGSEDGTVRMWDARKGGGAVHVIEPYKHNISSRPEMGKWIGCVAYDVSDDWLVCGGAPTLCVWHIRSLSPCTQLLKPNATSSVVHFYDDIIISAGSESCINHWSLDGNLQIEVPASASNILSIGIASNPSLQVLSAAGTSYKIDVCTDFRYKDFSLDFV